MAQWKIGDLELNKSEGFMVTDVNFSDHSTPSALAPRRGFSAWLADIKPEVVKVTMVGWIVGNSSLQELASFDVNNFDWLSPNSIYLTQNESKRWPILSLVLYYKPDKPLVLQRYQFTVVILLGTSTPEGVNMRSINGSSGYSQVGGGLLGSRPLRAISKQITGFRNDGTRDASFDTISFSSAGKAENVVLEFVDLGLDLLVSEVLLDGAILDIYGKKDLARYILEELFLDGTRWQDNAYYYDNNISWSSGLLDMPNSSKLDYYYAIGHPLIHDPTLIINAHTVVGSPKLKVAGTLGNWHEVGTILTGSKLYTLDKLYGLSRFYWEIECGESDSLQLNSLKLESWHSISGQPEVCVSSGATNEKANLVFDGVADIDYNLSWYDSDYA